MILDNHATINWHLSYTRYPLTSITWQHRGLKFTAHRGHMIFRSWPLTKCWFSHWIAGSCQVNLSEDRAGLFWSRIKVKNLSELWLVFYENVFCGFLLCKWWLFNWKHKLKQKTENLSAKLQNSNQNFTFSWVSLIRFWTTRARSYAFRLA